MDELDVIAEVLRQQREDIGELQHKALSRRSETTELLAKIEELRVRSEDTLRRFQSSAQEAELLNGKK